VFGVEELVGLGNLGRYLAAAGISVVAEEI
jgi:hypothetical protein